MAILADDTLSRILRETRAIALVGHSPKPQRPSYQIAQFLRSVGYQVYPIHPAVKEIDGHTCYASLAELPVSVDLVNVFRRAEFLPGIVQEAIEISAPTVWAQLDVSHPEAETLATAANLNLVMDRCIKIDYLRLLA